MIKGKISKPKLGCTNCNKHLSFDDDIKFNINMEPIKLTKCETLYKSTISNRGKKLNSLF